MNDAALCVFVYVCVELDRCPNSVVTHSCGDVQNKDITLIRKNTLEMCKREVAEDTKTILVNCDLSATKKKEQLESV